MLLIVIHLLSRTLASVAMINISRAWKQGELHVPFSLGNGSRILFWHHPVGSSVLKDRFPGLFRISSLPNGVVSDFLDPTCSAWCVFFLKDYLKLKKFRF